MSSEDKKRRDHKGSSSSSKMKESRSNNHHVKSSKRSSKENSSSSRHTNKRRHHRSSSPSSSSSETASSFSSYIAKRKSKSPSISKNRSKQSSSKKTDVHSPPTKKSENGYGSKKVSKSYRSIKSRSPSHYNKSSSHRHQSPKSHRRKKSATPKTSRHARGSSHAKTWKSGHEDRRKSRKETALSCKSPKSRQRKSSRHYSSSTTPSSRSLSPEISRTSLGSLVGLAAMPQPVPPPAMMFSIAQHLQQPLPPGVAAMSPVAPPADVPPPPPPPPPPGVPPPVNNISFSIRPTVYNPYNYNPFGVPAQPVAFGYSPIVPPPCQAPIFSPGQPPLTPVPPPPPAQASTSVTNQVVHGFSAQCSTMGQHQVLMSATRVSQTLQLPMPSNGAVGVHTEAIVAPPPPAPVPLLRTYDRPVILNKRQLPQVSENWGIGSLSNYNIIDQVGEGTYGQVYKASRKANAQDAPGTALVALKKVRLENEREGFPITAIREIKILRQLEHKNVVRLFDIVTDQKGGFKQQSKSSAFYLVFEYVDHDLNGLLDSNMVEFSELQVASLFKQLLLALEHCHNLNFLHRDIKCANILINNRGELKLGDFGLARLFNKAERLYTNRVITLWYRPPELLLGQEKYGTEVDIWSAGCILGELFVKKPIFQGNVELAQLEIISQYCGSPLPEIWPAVVNLPNFKTMRLRNYYPRRLRDKFEFLPIKALNLLDQLLQLDPKKRPSATEALNTEWLVNVDPGRVPPPSLPTNQDCHEMWSKKMKAQRNQQRQQQQFGEHSSTNGGNTSVQRQRRN